MTDSAVMGSTGTIKTLADGTFRVQIDIEPRFAQLAFSLFGSPGTPIALARITNEAAVEHDRKQQEPEKPKGGPLAKLAGMWCNDPDFWRWINRERSPSKQVETAEGAAQWLRWYCGIDSRAELDGNEEAAIHFRQHVRQPFMQWGD